MRRVAGTQRRFDRRFQGGNVTSLGLSQPVDVEIFTATGALHENEPWGDIQRVTYELKDPASAPPPARTSSQHHAQSVKLDHAGRQDQPLLSAWKASSFHVSTARNGMMPGTPPTPPRPTPTCRPPSGSSSRWRKQHGQHTPAANSNPGADRFAIAHEHLK